MKHLLRTLVLGMALSYSIAQAADDGKEGYRSAYILDAQVQDLPEQEEKSRPTTLDIHYDWIQKAKFKSREFRGQKIAYSIGEVEASFEYYSDPCNNEGLNASLAYTRTNLKLNQNPFFSQEHFDTVTLNLGGFSARLKDWLWKAEVNFNFDVDHISLWEYTTYDMLLWGRYTFCENVRLHLGVLAQTGMKIDWVYPVLGFDWKISDQWKLNVIFPLDVSAVYTINCNWSVALAGRFFSTRHRVGSHAEVKKGLWTYRQTGAELAVNYTSGKWLSLNLHGGHTFQGNFKIANRHYKHKHRYKFDGAFYAGGEAVLNF